MANPEAASGAGSRLDNGLAGWVELSLVGAVLLLAGALRMASPGLSEFKADEARLLSLAYDMAEGELVLRGISSSVGVPNFPASVWLYALPVSIWPHPYAATIFTGLLSTLAVALTYWFVRRYWGVWAGLAATLLYAVSPWAILFSRKIWAQNLLPLFVMGWAISATLALVERRPRFMWLHLLCLALAVQIHLSTLALIPATILLLIIFRRQVSWRDVLIGGLLALLTAVPFAIYISRKQVPGGLAAAAASGTGGQTALDSLRYTIMISVGEQIHSLAGPGAFNQYLTLVPDLKIMQWLWGLLILAGISHLIWQAWRRWPQPQAQVGLIVMVWLLMPILFFLRQWTPVFLHYFITVLPAPYIAAGVAFGQIPRALSRLWPGASPTARRLVSAGSWVMLAVTVAAQAGALLALLNFVGGKATPGGFGVPLAMKLEAAEQAQRLMKDYGANEVLVAGEGEAPLVDEFAAEWDVLLRDLPHRFVDATRNALYPAEPAVVLLDGRLVPENSVGDLYIDAATTVINIPLRPGEGSYAVLALPGAARPAPDVSVDPPYLLANWVNLLGYDRPSRRDSETATWQIHWRSGDNPDPANYQFFNHLLDSDGARIGQVDAAAFDPAQWRAGDTLISRFGVPWQETASGPLTMRVGMYRYPSLENVPLLDEAGNPYIDAAEFLIDN